MNLTRTKLALVAAAALVLACTPALDWREHRPEGLGLVALLPCKASSYARTVQLAGQPVPLALQACSADGLTWALTSADLGDAARVPAALAELKSAALVNLGAVSAKALPLSVAGASAGPAPERFELAGRLPDGKVVEEQVALFARGSRVFQATVLGPHLPAEAVETFFGGLRFLP